MQIRRAPGFVAGFLSPFGALRTLSSAPRAWPLVLVPSLVFILLELMVALLSWELLMPWVRAQASTLHGLPAWLGTSLGALSLLLALALGFLLSAGLAPVLSSPALERLVRLIEEQLKVPARAPLGFFAELRCGFSAMLLGWVITLPCVLGLTLFEIAAPAVVVVTMPLKLLFGALGIAWGLLDYPLTLRGVRAGERLRFMFRNFSAVLGFGAGFALLFSVPCFGIVMLPVGVVAATRLCWELEGAVR
jgi:uncharacterized protein involved in cysteine biosynthesis